MRAGLERMADEDSMDRIGLGLELEDFALVDPNAVVGVERGIRSDGRRASAAGTGVRKQAVSAGASVRTRPSDSRFRKPSED